MFSSNYLCGGDDDMSKSVHTFQVEVLQKVLRAVKANTSRSRSVSPSRSSQRSRSRSPNKSGSCHSSPHGTPVKGDKKAAAHYEGLLRVLEDERDHYKRECDVLRAVHSRPVSPSRSFSKVSSPSCFKINIRDETFPFCFLGVISLICLAG